MANCPLKRAKAPSPQASQAWTITSVSLRVRKRWPSPSSSAAQLDVVVDLAVEDDPEGAVLVAERLLPGGEVDDGEPGVGQAGPLVAVEAELVGAAVAHGPEHGPQVVERRRREALLQGDHAGDAAHG